MPMTESLRFNSALSASSVVKELNGQLLLPTKRHERRLWRMPCLRPANRA